LALVVLAVLAVLLLGPAYAWAAPSPVPVPSHAPGQVWEAGAWSCERTAASTVMQTPQVDNCAVSQWVPVNVQPSEVAVRNFPAVQSVTVPTPVAVREVSPASGTTTNTTMSCGGESSPAPSATATACVVELAAGSAIGINDWQWLSLCAFLGILLILSAVRFYRSEAGALRV